MSALRRGMLAAATAALAALLALLPAGPAFAHAYITATSPVDGAQLATAPRQVTLTFDEPVTHVHVAVEGPGGLRWEAGSPVVVDERVTQRIEPLGPAGRYQVNFRVVSVDGHTVQGSVAFTLTTAGPGTPPPQEVAADETAHGSGFPLWLVVIIAAGVALMGVAWAITARRFRGRGQAR